MFVLLVIVGSLLTCSASPIERIVNGTNAKEGEIPYIVSLRYFNSHICGASILNDKYMLTAAHCVYGRTENPSALSIQYGVTKITSDFTRAVLLEKIVIHPDYINSGTYENDVAVLTIKGRIKLSDVASPTVLPILAQPTPGNREAVLAGWGYPYSGGSQIKDLQRVDIKIYTDEDCINAHHGRTNPKYHICAGIPEGGKGQCTGDSGGPLNVNGVQFGVVSWSTKPCAQPGYPGVFTNIANYVDWISAQIN